MALGEVDRATAGALAQVDRTFLPAPARVAVYDRLYAEFPRLYKSQKAIFRRLNAPSRQPSAAKP